MVLKGLMQNIGWRRRYLVKPKNLR